MSLKQRFTTTAASLALAFGLTAAAQAQDRITYKVVGQPAATGLIQKNKEKPFFDEFAKRTGLPIDADYKTIDSLGIKDTEQLRVMKAGLFDIVSLRVSQNSRDEPTLLGMDLVGAAPDYAPAKAVPGQAARHLALRPADPVLQEADHATGRPEGHEGPRLRPEPGQVHRIGGWHAGAAVLQ
jgi:TRAP-type C4-dicarboxylate transport system substrate-binding protein